ncbi:unnamed protein product [Urochloa humidicola]
MGIPPSEIQAPPLPTPGTVPAVEAPAAPAVPTTLRWAAEIKVYSRKYPRKTPKPPPPEPAPAPSPAPAPTPASAPAAPARNPNPLSETLFSIRRSIRRAETRGAAARPDPVAAASTPPPAPPGGRGAASGDPSSGQNRDGGGVVPNGRGDDRASLAVEKAEKAWKRRVRSELRRRLAGELDQVRVLSGRLKEAAEALAQQEASEPAPVLLEVVLPPQVVDSGYVQSQFSDGDMVTPMSAQLIAGVPPVRSLLRRPLTVSVVHNEAFEKEKRTPKANQLYQNSEFLLAKDRIPPSDSHGRKKSKHHKKKHRSFESRGADFDAERRLYSHAFKKSSSLLSRLMKHKFAWVFNKPVDPVALGLHDYFTIIKHPMDLGTIRVQLSKGQYRNPKEFADDVRLTFHNAMTYNPKGQDVHFMAEQLLGIFEAQWPEIEAEVNYLAS